MKYANVIDNIVVEIFPYNPFEMIKDPVFLLNCREVPDEVEQHWTYDQETDTYTKPKPIDPPEPGGSAWDERAKAIREGVESIG